MDTLFKRHFLLTAGMILLSFALLAVAFVSLSYQYSFRQQRESLDDKASYVAALAGQLMYRNMLNENENFEGYVAAAAQLIDSDIVLCQADGVILFACDEGNVNWDWKGRAIPSSVLDQMSSAGSYTGMSDLNIYSGRRFVSGAPISLTIGETVYLYGYAFVSSSAEDLTEMWRVFATIFFFTAVVVLCVAFISSSIFSLQQTKPLKDMTDIVRRFGMGEYDLRVDDCKRNDEVGELARAFNSMAESIASAEQRRSEFVANISHELKTPMTTISGFADGILDGTIPPEREREYLQTISDETRRLARLVRRMLDMSKLQSGELVLSQTEFDINEIMAQVLISLEGKINSRSLDVDAHIPDSATMVWGDPDAVTQVCYNLLDNAIKFSTPGTVIGVAITPRAGKAYVSVRDTGETIPAEELPLIFDRLHKSDRSRSLDKEGVGLGLYLVKTILNNLKETITVHSKDGVTEFVFTLTLSC